MIDHALSCCVSTELSTEAREDLQRNLARLREASPEFATWATGHGVIVHDDLTQLRVHAMVRTLVDGGRLPDATTGYRRLQAADRIASAGMWLVAHMTYARRVRIDGTTLEAEDFKPEPEGHTGGSLNMVPAYTAYLLMNALDGRTRSWRYG